MTEEACVSRAEYQLLRPLSEGEYAALRASIVERGVLVPVELDDKGKVLDGHHRLRICRELGLKDYPTIIRPGLSEPEKRAHILTLNADRRHLSQEEKRDLARTLPGSTRQVAEKLGISPQTVMRARVPNGTPNARVKGRDGKSYPARRPAVIATNRQEERRALDAVQSGANFPAKMVGANRAVRLGREHKAELRAQEAKGDVRLGKATLLLGDMRERGAEVPDESVDLVFTDPPYPEEYLPLWSDLSALAARVLKPNGMLIAYTGAMYLPGVINGLGGLLRYWWAGAVVLDGPHSRVHARRVAQGSKQLLFFVRDAFVPSEWLEDTYQSEGEQKDGHDWQQSLGCAAYYIGKLLPKGGMVLDPFLGAGTTGRAALDRGCDFVGIENDPKAFAVAQERLRGEGSDA